MDRFKMAGLALATATIPFVAGCGDDGTTVTCIGHACANAAIGLPEGGEIRLELIQFKDGPLEARTHAWFATAQTPDSRPWPREPDKWNTVEANVCADMKTGTIWPSGDPTSRTYVDVGATVTIAGGGKMIVLDRGMDVEDDTERNIHDIGYITEADLSQIVPNTEYSISAPGAGNIPAFTVEPGLYMPQNFQTSFPDMDQTVIIPKGKDFPIIWDAPANTDEFQFAFVALLDVIDPTVFCIGPNNGQMTIPKAMLDKATPGGSIKVGVLSHRAAPLFDNTRRADVVGINCKLSSYIITSDTQP